MIEIRPLADVHCRDVARLHLAYLATPFSGRPGLELLRCYYLAVAEGHGACGYVAESDGSGVAYVCGVWQPAEVRAQLLSRYWKSVLLWGVMQIIARPALVIDFMLRVIRPVQFDHRRGYELRPIVVSAHMRGTGLAAELVSALCVDAQRRGYECIHLYTETDNEAANRFYLKDGFVVAKRQKASQMGYLKYERALK